MARLELRRRSRVLGLPIGPRRTHWPTVLRLGAGAVAGAASLVAARARAMAPSSTDGEGPEDEGPEDEGPEDEGPEDEGPEDEGPRDGETATDAQAVHYDGNGRPRDEHGRFVAMDDGDDGGERRERAAGRERQGG